MKILFYIHGLSGGGAERVLVTLANALVSKGEIVSIATNTNIPPAYTLNKDVSLLNIREGCKESDGYFYRIKNAMVMRWNLRRIAKREAPDIIIAMMSSVGCSVVLFTFGLKIPVIISEHTNVTRSYGKFFEIKRRLLYPLASCITVLTKYDYNLWKERYKNVVRMPNPINLGSTLPNKNEREKVVLAAGRVNQWQIKGFDNLIKCWGQVCWEFPTWKLQIAGEADNTSKEVIEEYIKKWNCINVELLGFRSDLKSVMERSEIFCLSSRVEGLPMVLIEAMNSGCCCISFDVMTGPGEIIIRGKSGLLAQNQDVSDLAEKLKLVMSNSHLRSQFQNNAPHDVMKYDTKKVVKRWYILFSKILAKE